MERFKRGAENREIIEAQLETIEDVVKYVHEQSMTISNPEEVTFQLDTLISEVEETRIHDASRWTRPSTPSSTGDSLRSTLPKALDLPMTSGACRWNRPRFAAAPG